MTIITYPNLGIESKKYTCETFSKSVFVNDWHECLRNIPQDVVFKIITTISYTPHNEWVDKVEAYMKKNKKSFAFARNKVPTFTQKELFCLKSTKVKGYLTIDTIDGEDVPFESIEAIVFNEVKYSLTNS